MQLAAQSQLMIWSRRVIVRMRGIDNSVCGMTHGVLQVLSRHSRLFHVPSLLLKLHQLVLIHPLLLQRAQRSLLNCGLKSAKIQHDMQPQSTTHTLGYLVFALVPQ